MTEEEGIQPVPLESIQRQIEEATEPAALRRINDQLEVIQLMAKRSKFELSEQNRIGLMRIETLRKIGKMLKATVQHGGKSEDKPRGGSPAPLPEGIDKTFASRCRKVAGIPATVIADYAKSAIAQARTVSRTGLVRFASPSERESRSRRKSSNGVRPFPDALGADLRDRIERAMEVDATVGPSCVDPIGDTILGETALATPLPPRVVVLEPGVARRRWIAKLRKEVDASRVEEAIVVFAIDLASHVVRELPVAAVCYPAETPATRALAYIGLRPRAFCLCFRDGGVFERCCTDGD